MAPVVPCVRSLTVVAGQENAAAVTSRVSHTSFDAADAYSQSESEADDEAASEPLGPACAVARTSLGSCASGITGCEGAGLSVVAWVASPGCPARFARASGHADGSAARPEWLRVGSCSGPIQMMNSAIAAYWHAAAAQT